MSKVKLNVDKIDKMLKAVKKKQQEGNEEGEDTIQITVRWGAHANCD